LTPSGLSIEIRKNRFCRRLSVQFPPVSIPAGWATRSAMASIFERIALVLYNEKNLTQNLVSNKKVGFRPLHEFDTYNSIVACLGEKRNFQSGREAERRTLRPADCQSV